jgi:divalent metal cation (Fe/Co/Zn/Cd) transporter
VCSAVVAGYEVVLGALGMWLGFPAADPLIGLVITAMIIGIVWQST